ncbi:MAG TPA: hypothetical protein VHW46_03840 [Terracidiphilus sp.]|nr:hypothetical protein [Terracidiphilus sp.]
MRHLRWGQLRLRATEFLQINPAMQPTVCCGADATGAALHAAAFGFVAFPPLRGKDGAPSHLRWGQLRLRATEFLLLGTSCDVGGCLLWG